MAGAVSQVSEVGICEQVTICCLAFFFFLVKIGRREFFWNLFLFVLVENKSIDFIFARWSAEIYFDSIFVGICIFFYIKLIFPICWNESHSM